MHTHQLKRGPGRNRTGPAPDRQAELLHTKLLAPLPRPNLIARRLLIERLNKARDARLLLITAPTGFGKTTLLSEWLAQLSCEGEPCLAAWVSLEEAENDFEMFWRYLMAALQRVDPSLGARATGVSGPPAEKPVAVDTWPGILIADLEQSNKSLYLVLDDYHVIHNVAVHQSLNYLWQHMPAHAHLVFISRADPPLPLARLRVQDALFELRSADLQFTDAESAAYLNEVMMLELSPDDVGRLARRTEGWPAGLYLVARLLLDRDRAERHQFIATFSGSNHLILNYLLEEVLQQQPPEVRNFLLRTSILSRLSVSLCAAVTDQPLDVTAQALARLAQDNLFLIPLDEEGCWFRYHSLFAESMATRLGESAPQLWNEIHHKAYAWCVNNGYTERAITHALAGKDFDAAANLIELAGDGIWTGGDLAVALHWLDMLPRSLIEERPMLRLLYAWLLFLHDRWPEVTPLWEKTGSLLAERDPGAGNICRGRWAAIGGAMCAHHLQPEETIRLSELALALLPPDDHVWRAVGSINLALAYYAQGNTGKAACQYKAILDGCNTRGELYLVFVALAHLIEACFAQGRLFEAQVYSERLRELEALPGGQALELEANANVNLGRLAYERDDLPGAERLLSRAIDRLWPDGQPRMVLAARLALSRLFETRGDCSSAREQLALALEMVTCRRMAPEESIVRAHLARLALREGRWDDVRAWQEASDLGYRDLPDFRREFEHVVLAEVLIAEGRYEQAESLLARLRSAAERAGRSGSDLILSLLAVVALVHQKREAEAEAMARHALILAQPQGYVRSLLDLGPSLLHILMRPTVRRMAPDYVDRLCRAMQTPFQPPASHLPSGRHHNGHNLTPLMARESSLMEPISPEKLTPREWEILAMIAEGASNQQIADDLILSVGTVKGHVNHIFGKLDVHSRTAAVARARDFGLIGK